MGSSMYMKDGWLADNFKASLMGLAINLTTYFIPFYTAY